MENEYTNESTRKYQIGLYLEQIKYLRQENISIQNCFLAASSIPLTAVGLLVYYIETSEGQKVQFLYLILPF